MRKATLTVELILGWADEYHVRAGQWPNTRSGPVSEAPGETWKKVNEALRRARRGLTRFSSLARLLEKERGVRAGLDQTQAVVTALRQEAVRLRRQG
jgi:hypothetical protein